MQVNYFTFKKWKKEYLITNEMGKFLFLEDDEFEKIVQGQFQNLPPDLLQRLKEAYFIFDGNEDVFVESVIDAYRENKSYIFSSTCLHIFVLTNACNLCCVYCQAQDSGQRQKGRMTREVAKKAVDIALQSPERRLDFEFQGGEPLSNFEMIRFIIEYSQGQKNDKEIRYSVVTNLMLLTEEMADFFRRNHVTISTSLDGNMFVHDANRPKPSGKGTYKTVMENICRLQEMGIFTGAIQTTTKTSLDYAKEIINAYKLAGLPSLFVRPLTPLGYAKEQWEKIGYMPEEFIAFYKKVLQEILNINRQGYFMSEGHARIFLRKIIGGCSENYMELRSPCGAGVGQMAYYYDGKIYTCDEGRMLAEMGDDSFCMGNVWESTYDSLMDSMACRVTCQASVLEGLPSCCDCVYHPYCGVCPVINLAMDQNIYERQANNYRCKIYKGILDTLFETIYKDKSTVEIFKTWIS